VFGISVTHSLNFSEFVINRSSTNSLEMIESYIFRHTSLNWGDVQLKKMLFKDKVDSVKSKCVMSNSLYKKHKTYLHDLLGPDTHNSYQWISMDHVLLWMIKIDRRGKLHYIQCTKITSIDLLGIWIIYTCKTIITNPNCNIVFKSPVHFVEYNCIFIIIFNTYFMLRWHTIGAFGRSLFCMIHLLSNVYTPRANYNKQYLNFIVSCVSAMCVLWFSSISLVFVVSVNQ